MEGKESGGKKGRYIVQNPKRMPIRRILNSNAKFQALYILEFGG